jgi:predicted nucleic acid-binding protein
MPSTVVDERVLVDTSAWISFFRGMEPGAAAVAELIDTRRALRCGPVELELRRGLRRSEAHDVLAVWRGLETLDTDGLDFTIAGDLLRDLRERGITIPSLDGLIAALAIRHAVPLLAFDQHFDGVPALVRWRTP